MILNKQEMRRLVPLIEAEIAKCDAARNAAAAIPPASLAMLIKRRLGDMARQRRRPA